MVKKGKRIFPKRYEGSWDSFEHISTHNKLKNAKEAGHELRVRQGVVKIFRKGKKYGVYVNWERMTGRSAPLVPPKIGKIRNITSRGKYYIEKDEIKKRKK